MANVTQNYNFNTNNPILVICHESNECDSGQVSQARAEEWI